MNIVQQEPIAWIEWDLELDEGDPSSVMVQQIKPDLCYKGWDWRPLVLATPQQAAPAGWVLVPIKHTYDMEIAFRKRMSPADTFDIAYRDLLKAAPKAKP